MSKPERKSPAATAVFILQDRKRLPARFFAALSGTELHRFL